MKIKVAVVVEAREESLWVRLASGPICCVPRSAVRYGEFFHGGERDVDMDLATYAYKEIMRAIEMAKNGREGQRVLDAQILLWSGLQ